MQQRLSRDVAIGALILCCGVGAGLVAMRPSSEVRFEARLAQLEPDAALLKLHEAQGVITFSDNLELLYARLLLADGDLEGARQSVMRLLARSPFSVATLDMLAEIEMVGGDLPRAIVALRSAYNAEPSAERRSRLAGWYGALRMTDAECALLASVTPTVLSRPENDRLSLLLIKTGRVSEYQDLLSGLAEGDGPDHLVFKRRWLEHLVESGRPADAVTAASRWANGPNAAAVLETSIQALIGRGAINAAIRLARIGFAIAPADGHVALPALARSGHGGVARMLQAEWLAHRQRLSADDWGTLTAVTESTGDLNGLHAAFASGKGLASPEATADALMQVLRYRGPEALLPYRGLLERSVTDHAPLLGAAWAMWRGDRVTGYHHMLSAAQQPLSNWDQLIWMSLAEGLQGTPFYRQLLAGAIDHPGLRQRLRDSVIPARQLDVSATGSVQKPG